jgi:hypothetical protein
MRRSLAASNLPPGTNLDALGVVETQGQYSGRRVTFVRVFDPARAVARAVNVFTRHTYEDLNAHQDLVLRAGIIERDGTIVLFPRTPAREAVVPSRVRADRAAHTDDERFVFPDGDAAQAQREEGR